MAHSIAKAVAYSRAQLAQIGADHDTPLEWALAWIPEGSLDMPEVDRLTAMPSDSDERLYESVRLVQRFVYGDEGDEAAGVPAQPATDDEADGYFGPGTMRRVYAWEAHAAGVSAPSITDIEHCDYIVMCGERIHVPGVRIVQPEHQGGLSFEYAHRRRGGSRPFLPWSREWSPGSGSPPHGCALLSANHWDVCHSARDCFGVLLGKGFSSTFGIDSPIHDGHVYVYQWLDFGKNRGYHGNSPANNLFLESRDINNAVYLRYRARATERASGNPRPLITATTHGKRKHITGAYRGQILAAIRISKALAERFPRLSYALPAVDGHPVIGLWRDILFGGRFNGCATHLHWGINKKGKPDKSDVAGFEDQIIYMMRKDPAIAHEFPVIAEAYRVHCSSWDAWESERDEAWDWPEVQGGTT